MINILGNDGSSGPYAIQGLSQTLSVPGVKLYVYGKKASKPGRNWSYYCYRQDSKRSAKSRFEGEKPTRACVEGDDGNNGMNNSSCRHHNGERF